MEVSVQLHSVMLQCRLIYCFTFCWFHANSVYEGSTPSPEIIRIVQVARTTDTGVMGSIPVSAERGVAQLVEHWTLNPAWTVNPYNEVDSF